MCRSYVIQAVGERSRERPGPGWETRWIWKYKQHMKEVGLWLHQCFVFGNDMGGGGGQAWGGRPPKQGHRRKCSIDAAKKKCRAPAMAWGKTSLPKGRGLQ